MSRSQASAAASSDEFVARSGLREQVAERLLMAIFEKRFNAGDRLIVQRLSEMYGVSPTPVRESLVEIAGLGLVELLPNRGAVVNAFGPRELSEMCQVRRVLECEAAQSTAARLMRRSWKVWIRNSGSLKR